MSAYNIQHTFMYTFIIHSYIHTYFCGIHVVYVQVPRYLEGTCTCMYVLDLNMSYLPGPVVIMYAYVYVCI